MDVGHQVCIGSEIEQVLVPLVLPLQRLTGRLQLVSPPVEIFLGHLKFLQEVL